MAAALGPYPGHQGHQGHPTQAHPVQTHPSQAHPSQPHQSLQGLQGHPGHPGHAANRMNQGRVDSISQQHYAPRKAERRYELSVEQQPIRARMCGFGDKDRRPITPPPCIRLVVYDAKTGQELDFNDIDSTYFVLMVDLWNEEMQTPVNLVRHSSAAPTVSISSSTTTSYPPPPERSHFVTTAALAGYDPTPYRSQMAAAAAQGMVAPGGYGAHTGMPVPSPQQAHQQQQQHSYYTNPVPPPQQTYPQQYPTYPSPTQTMMAATPMGSNHTRNLIGMNAVNACRLNDINNKPGFWFVLQDLSVRTEGTFRLKLLLFDIGRGDGTNGTVSNDGPTRGKGDCLAVNFSEAFTVYSAKKFPGVIESTPLSKCFAQQGIKIPIRKDGPKLPNQAEYDADD